GQDNPSRTLHPPDHVASIATTQRTARTSQSKDQTGDNVGGLALALHRPARDTVAQYPRHDRVEDYLQAILVFAAQAGVSG
ncbi:MAG: hypothetical protein ACRD0H_17930, partial [Actinomycetes bacterium]